MDESLFLEFEKFLNGDQSHESFIQFYKFRIEALKITPEYLEVVEDIKLLISLDESELEKKIINLFSEIENFPTYDENETQEENIEAIWSEIDLKKNIEYIKKLPMDNLSPDETNLSFLFLLGKILTADYEARFKGEQLLSKNTALVQYLINIRMEFNFKKLISLPEFQDMPIDLVYKIRDLGADHFLSDSTETLQNKQLQELLHKIIASHSVNKRHAKRQNDYESAVDYAEYLWSVEGRAHTINEMVEHLLNKKQYEHLFERSLREKIYKTAQKYKKIPPRGRPPKKK